MKNPDYIIVGSGFAGSILAERIANELDKKVLIIEKRNHIAGNMYDYKDENNILVHKYGPHLFRTNEDKVKNYLSRFTKWHEYKHQVVASINDKLVPVPFNLTSLKTLFPLSKSKKFKEKLIRFFALDSRPTVYLKHLYYDTNNSIFDRKCGTKTSARVHMIWT